MNATRCALDYYYSKQLVWNMKKKMLQVEMWRKISIERKSICAVCNKLKTNFAWNGKIETFLCVFYIVEYAVTNYSLNTFKRKQQQQNKKAKQKAIFFSGELNAYLQQTNNAHLKQLISLFHWNSGETNSIHPFNLLHCFYGLVLTFTCVEHSLIKEYNGIAHLIWYGSRNSTLAEIKVLRNKTYN